MFLGTLAGGLLAAPLATQAQQPGKVHRIGYLGVTTASSYARHVEALRLGLRDLGYVEGKNLAIEYRWAEDKYDRLPERNDDDPHRHGNQRRRRGHRVGR